MLPDLNQIQTVLLDMDGTLLDLHFDNYFWQTHVPQVYAEQNGIETAAAVAKLTPLFRAHQGTLNWYCVDFWSAELGLDIMQHKADVAHKIAYRPQAEDFLQQCQQRVADTRLITNGHRKVLSLKVEFTGLDKYFREMICSHELGAAKESQDFWHALQEQRGFDPEHTLFIDDNEEVLDSAARYGVRHVFSIEKPDLSGPSRGKELSKYPLLGSF